MMARITFWLGSFVIFQGFCTIIAKKPYMSKNLQGGGGEGPVPLSGSARENVKILPYILGIVRFIIT